MSPRPRPSIGSPPEPAAPLRRIGVVLAAVLAGLLVPAPLRGGATVLLVTLGGVALLQARAVGWFAPARSAPRTLDPLTGLADAGAFRTFVHAELDGAERRIGLLWLELRQVGLLRSTFGREALESLYTTIAGRLRRSVRGDDGLAHFGDGLFAVALRDPGDPVGFARAAERLRAEVARPLLIAGTRVRPTWAAAGVAAPEDGRTADTLLAAAEAAREMASAEPGEPLRRLPAASRTAAEDRRHRQRELLQAAECGAFFPLFQPQLDLATGAIDRVEMLMRWRRTDGSVAPPAVFLDQLRELDALPRVSDGVYRAALGEAADWRAAGFAFSRLALNLDATQVAGADWAERLLALLATGPLAPADVEVEVSENILEHAQLDRLVDGLVVLRAAGVRVSLDDFGTGYASLSQIADLPLDLVKLDARLVWDAAASARTRLVVEGIVALMRKLDLPCVFEGVETPAHLALARALGARWAQGFLVGRPMPGPDLEARLSVRRARPARPARASAALFDA
jgi:EAL domain-containing protein (putative c-di-GMP-specific phosphodiesterase class I)/GGDEF domain-containing protein